MIQCTLILTNGYFSFHLPEEKRNDVVGCFTAAKTKKQMFAFQFNEGPVVIDFNHLLGVLFQNENPPTQ